MMNKNSRGGYSLIELSAVLGVCSVLAGISVWLVHMSMQKTRDGQRHLAAQQAVARAAETFRRDVHAAVSIVKDPAEKDAKAPNGTVWSLRLGAGHLGSGNIVRYRLQPGRLVRDEFSPTASASAKTKTAASHETFNLSPAAELSISTEPPSAPRTVSLLITTPNNKSIRIDAAMSLDHRFQQIQTVKGKKPDTSEEKVEK